MTALGEWLKQIVLIVVIAILADLLLPTKAMQKYVRVVMGLAVIAAMLQPIIPYFQRDWADKLASAATNEITAQGALNMTPNSIEIDSLKQQLQQETNTEENHVLGMEISTIVAKQFDCKIDGVTVTGTNATDRRVSVRISPMSQVDKVAVRNWIAAQVEITKSQVDVS